MSPDHTLGRMLALPLRITPEGQLDRAAPLDSLLGMIKVMATTSRRAWPHAPWFGLLEAFSEATTAVTDHPRIALALNAALDGLGVEWARVSSVKRVVSREASERDFEITMLIDGQPVYGRVAAQSSTATSR